MVKIHELARIIDAQENARIRLEEMGRRRRFSETENSQSQAESDHAIRNLHQTSSIRSDDLIPGDRYLIVQFSSSPSAKSLHLETVSVPIVFEKLQGPRAFFHFDNGKRISFPDENHTDSDQAVGFFINSGDYESIMMYLVLKFFSSDWMVYHDDYRADGELTRLKR
jgi:hypothetical protein